MDTSYPVLTFCRGTLRVKRLPFFISPYKSDRYVTYNDKEHNFLVSPLLTRSEEEKQSKLILQLKSTGVCLYTLLECVCGFLCECPKLLPNTEHRSEGIAKAEYLFGNELLLKVGETKNKKNKVVDRHYMKTLRCSNHKNGRKIESVHVFHILLIDVTTGLLVYHGEVKVLLESEKKYRGETNTTDAYATDVQYESPVIFETNKPLSQLTAKEIIKQLNAGIRANKSNNNNNNNNINTTAPIVSPMDIGIVNLESTGPLFEEIDTPEPTHQLIPEAMKLPPVLEFISTEVKWKSLPMPTNNFHRENEAQFKVAEEGSPPELSIGALFNEDQFTPSNPAMFLSMENNAVVQEETPLSPQVSVCPVSPVTFDNDELVPLDHSLVIAMEGFEEYLDLTNYTDPGKPYGKRKTTETPTVNSRKQLR